jgi:hypothetical protein
MNRYPVWDAVVDWPRCERQLIIPSLHKHQGSQSRIVINLDALKSPSCEWIAGCQDMKDLRYFLAKYLQERYWKRISNALGFCVPSPRDEKLTDPDIVNLLGCVQKWRGEKKSPQKERGRTVIDDWHLSLHNCIQITHPEIAGEVSTECPLGFLLLIKLYHVM